MATLLIGFDSAWTASNAGAIVAIVQNNDCSYTDLGPPVIADFDHATRLTQCWRQERKPDRVLILIDQPTIVPNATGQRPVENIVSSAISKRRGGMQPANTGRAGMFCENAPVWPFLSYCGGATNPFAPTGPVQVYETYPALAMIAFGWTLPDAKRPLGRLPKYNPERRKTFSLSDWHHVCGKAEQAFSSRALHAISDWIRDAGSKSSPRKADQDRLDASICLLVALGMSEGKQSLIIGDFETGFILSPHNDSLRAELEARCARKHRIVNEHVRELCIK
jgi:predicted RNase H-like nuclease